MTRKPCPCCKKVDSSRKADDICYDCRHKIESVGRLENLLKEQQDKTTFLMPVVFGQRAYWNAYFSLPGNEISERKFANELQEHFLLLAISASVQSIFLHDNQEATRLLGEGQGTFEPASHRLINKDVAEAIMKLRELIEPLAQEMYERGQANAVDTIERFDKIKEIVHGR